MDTAGRDLRERTLFWIIFAAVTILILSVNYQTVATELSPAKVESVMVEKVDDQERVVITNSRKVKYEVLELGDPPRLVIDLHNAVYTMPQRTMAGGGKVILQVRSGQYLAIPEKIVRVVIDLKRICPYTITQANNRLTATIFSEVNKPAGRKSTADSVSAPAELLPKHLLSLNLRGVTLENAFKILTKKTGINFLLSPDLLGEKVNVYLRDVPVETAILTILKANGLWYEREEGTNVYIIKRIKGPLPVKTVTEIIKCQYTSVTDLEDVIKKNLTSAGTFTLDRRTNSVIVEDVPARVEDLRKILSDLDQPSRQVLIAVKIVEINLTRASELGISWDWTGKAGKGSPIGAATLKSSFNTVAEGMLNFSIGKYASDVGIRDLTSMIAALEKWGCANLLANPKILTLDGKSASIRITEHIAMARKVTYQATAAGQVPVEEPVYGDVGVILIVTPHVLNNRFTILDVKPTVSSARKSTYFPDQAVDTQERTAETSVMVEDGQTIVIGGLFRKEKKTNVAKVPLLGNIPILGHLFRKTITDLVKTEVTVFLTPHIITVGKR